MTGCRDSGCPYSPRGGQRTNGGCKCDSCPGCRQFFRRSMPDLAHREWCTQKDWTPPWKAQPIDGPTTPETGGEPSKRQAVRHVGNRGQRVRSASVHPTREDRTSRIHGGRISITRRQDEEMMARGKTGTYRREWWVAMDLGKLRRGKPAKILADCGHEHRTMGAAEWCVRRYHLVSADGYRYVACKIVIAESCVPWGTDGPTTPETGWDL